MIIQIIQMEKKSINDINYNNLLNMTKYYLKNSDKSVQRILTIHQFSLIILITFGMTCDNQN